MYILNTTWVRTLHEDGFISAIVVELFCIHLLSENSCFYYLCFAN